jgi:hypothetical protein
MSSPMIRAFGHVAMTLATVGLVVFVALSGALAGGNNGTLKIHEAGTPDGFINNDPKVCRFNVEAYNLDPGQTGYLVFTVQGGDAPEGWSDGAHIPFPYVVADGYVASEYFGLQAGHYKATLYGKRLPSGELQDVKAKSKVFKVTCVGGGGGGGGEG